MTDRRELAEGLEEWGSREEREDVNRRRSEEADSRLLARIVELLTY
jgi:hypothetical protein